MVTLSCWPTIDILPTHTHTHTLHNRDPWQLAYVNEALHRVCLLKTTADEVTRCLLNGVDPCSVSCLHSAQPQFRIKKGFDPLCFTSVLCRYCLVWSGWHLIPHISSSFSSHRLVNTWDQSCSRVEMYESTGCYSPLSLCLLLLLQQRSQAVADGICVVAWSEALDLDLRTRVAACLTDAAAEGALL